MATTAPAAQSSESHIDPYVWRLSAVVVLGSIMSILDTTIVNVALERLHDDLHASLTTIQWVITGYMLSLAAVIPVSGWAARRFGAKRMYILALVLFTAGSALCGIATSTTELIVFRVLQGLGGGMIMPLGQMMMASAAGPKNMGRVMSITSIPTLLAPILGPTIGGLILQNLAWRWIFYVNVPVGILAVVLAIRILPSTKRSQTEPLDFVGLGLLSVGLPLLTYALAEIGTTGTFASSKVIVPCVIGIVLIAAFCLHALRARNPLLQLRLYSRATFASASFSMFCLGAALFGAMILLPLYWQTVRHESVLDTGLLTSPQGLGMVLVMPLVGKLVDKHGGGWFALFGVCLTTVATIPLTFVHTNTSIPYLFVVMMVRGMGIGLAFMPAMTAAFASLERHELSDATPQLNVLQRVGGSFGTAILTVVLQQHLDKTASITGAAARANAASASFGTAFWWSVGMVAVAIIPSIILVKAERDARRAKHGGEHEQEALDSGMIAEAMA